MNASGAARQEIDIIDYSVLVDTALKGKHAFLIVTERGIPGKLYDIGSWEQYEIELGGLLVGEDGPMYAKRSLDSKGPLIICPAGKYSNPTDKTTLLGVKATYSAAQLAAAAAAATSTFTISAVSIPSSDNIAVVVKRPGMADVVIADVALTNVDTKATTVTAVLADINAGTGTHGYSAAGSTVTGVITVTGTTALGAWGRNQKLSITAGTGLTLDTYNPSFTGGNDTTVVTGTILATALAKGAAYNNVSIAFTSAISNDPDKYDITLTMANSKLSAEVIRDVPKLASDADFQAKIDELIANSRMLSSLVFDEDYVLQPLTASLTGGTDGAALIPADYIGNREAQTNMYAFDSTEECPKICIPAIADGTVAKALADYVDERQDMMGLHRTPIGITTERTLDYRYGSGAYSHLPIDSWRNLMFAGDIVVPDPVNTKLKKTIHVIADVSAAIARKDVNVHEWFSFAGKERGVISNVLELVTNVGAPGLSSVNDNYDAAGIIPVVQDAKKKIYIHGDNTLWRSDTLLKKSNVAELLVFMYRSFRELIAPSFNPNDVEEWKRIYRTIQPWLEYLKDNRALWDYKYLGDQDVMDVSQATVNNSVNIDAGMYKANIGIKPKVNTKYVWFTIGVFNSGFDFSDITFE